MGSNHKNFNKPGRTPFYFYIDYLTKLDCCGNDSDTIGRNLRHH